MTTIDYTAPFSEARGVRTFHTAMTAIGSFLAGLWEGFVAYRRFEELTSWRVGHDIALRQAMEQHNSPAPARLLA
jgi:hypothetical protein